jgi:hypothetical protein
MVEALRVDRPRRAGIGIKRRDPPGSAGLSLDRVPRLDEHRPGTGAAMNPSPDPSSGASGAPAGPLIDSPLADLLEWDSPFRQVFVPGSDWAPWLATAKFPPQPPGTSPVRTVKPPDPPPESADDQAYAQYRRDYEARLDEAYARWKHSVFTSLFEPWIIDRRAAEAARKLGRAPAPGAGAQGANHGRT